MTAANKKIKHPYTFCSKSVGMLLLFYAIMLLRNTAFAASEAVPFRLLAGARSHLPLQGRYKGITKL